jgi:hypothetical protein
VGLREITEEEEKVIVYGWPTDAVGVWAVLRYGSSRELPKDFGRINLALEYEIEDTDDERVWRFVR